MAKIKKMIDPAEYWADKGFHDAVLGIRPRNRIAAYVKGYRSGKHYNETRKKYGFPTSEENPPITPAQITETQKKRYAKRRKYTGATAPEPAKENPQQARMIYGRTLEIRAQKTQQHICDAECKRVNHRYVHKFKPGAKIIGLPNGDILITKRR